MRTPAVPFLLATLAPLAAQHLEVQRSTPEVPFGHRVAYSPADGGLLTRGGIASLGTIDTRSLDRDTWLWSAATPSHEPPAIWQFALATDTARQRVVQFGGSAVTTGSAALDQTWEWDGTDWLRIATAVAPSPRRIEAMTFDAARGVMVLYGGFGIGGIHDPLGDTWEYDGVTWTQRQPQHQPPAGPGKLAFDPSRQVSVLLAVGGTWEWDGNDWRGPLAVETIDLDDVLVQDDSRGQVLRISDRGLVKAWDGAAWTSFGNSLADHFPVRFGFDPHPGGGLLMLDDAAEMSRFTGTAWQPVGPLLRPLPGDRSLQWDTHGDRLLSAYPHGLVTARDSATGQWRTIHPGSQPPAALRYGAWALDATRGQIVMHGITQIGTSGRTFLFDTTSEQWTEAHPNHPGPSTWGGAAAYDASRERVVLWGGEGGPYGLPPVWEWDGNDWHRIDVTFSPAIRVANAWMVYDPDRRVVVLFGGYSAAVPFFTDTWEWDGRRWSRRELHDPLLADRSISGAAYHVARRRIVALTTNGSSLDPQVIEWNGDAATWQLALGAGDPLLRGLGSILGYDPRRNEVVVAAANDLGWTIRSTDPAQSDVFGQGCPGSHGATPHLASSPTRLPWLDDRMTLEVTDLAPETQLATLLLGFDDRSWNGSPLPADLTPLGFTGCSLFVSIEVAELLTATGGRARWDLTLPADPHLLGDVLFAQAGAFDPGANPGGLALSNALRLQAGQR